MANPQKENGYTAIANEILDEICKIKLNDTQHRIVLAVWRYTYGFQRKEHDLGLEFLSKYTGMHKKQIQRELNTLIDKKILIVTSEATFNKPRKIKFNKNHEAWELDRGEVANQLPDIAINTHTDNSLIPSAGSEPVTQERNKENLKEKYICILDYWNSKEIVKHSSTDIMLKQIQKALKKHSKEDILKAIDNYATVYSDEQYYYNHIWRLDKFLKQSNGLPDFLEDGQVWLNYNSNKSQVTELECNPIFNINRR